MLARETVHAQGSHHATTTVLHCNVHAGFDAINRARTSASRPICLHGFGRSLESSRAVPACEDMLRTSVNYCIWTNRLLVVVHAGATKCRSRSIGCILTDITQRTHVSVLLIRSCNVRGHAPTRTAKYYAASIYTGTGDYVSFADRSCLPRCSALLAVMALPQQNFLGRLLPQSNSANM